MGRPVVVAAIQNHVEHDHIALAAQMFFYGFDGVCEICSVRDVQSEFGDSMPLIVTRLYTV